MPTLSAKEFLKGGLAKTVSTPVPSPMSSGLAEGFNNTNKALKNTGKTFAQGLNKTYKEAVPSFFGEAGRHDEAVSKNPIIAVGENTLGSTASALSTIFAPFTEGLKAVSKTVSDNPKVQKFAQKDGVGKVIEPFKKAGDYVKKIAKDNPEDARNIMNALTVGLTLLGQKGLDKSILNPKSPPNVAKLKADFAPDGNSSNTMKMYDKLIEAKEMTPEQVYSNVGTKTFQPNVAKQVISDAVNSVKIEGFPELASKLEKSLNANNLNPDILLKTANDLLSGGKQSVAPILLKDSSTLAPLARTASKIVEAGPGTISYAKSRVPKLLGIATGEGDDIVKLALKNPEIADKGIAGGDEALRRAVEVGGQKSVQLRDSFVKGHSEAFRQLAGQDSGKLVSKQRVLYDFADQLSTQNVKIKNGQLDFTISKIKANPGEVAKISAAYEAIKHWNDFSLSGMNDLKQLIGRLTKFPTESGGTSKSPFLGKAYFQIDETIKKNLPADKRVAYTEMNKKFSENIELFEDMVDAFNSGDPFVKLANALGKNKDSLRQVIEFYEKQSGEKVLPIVAGRELAMEKTAAFGLLNPRSWIDLLISPEKQAKAVTSIGRTFPNLSNLEK